MSILNLQGCKKKNLIGSPLFQWFFFLVQVLRLSTPKAIKSRNYLNRHFLVMTRTLPNRLKNLSTVFFVTLLVTPAAFATSVTSTVVLSLTNLHPAITARNGTIASISLLPSILVF